ncbi:MAG: (2Fe-2S)-binding protein [Pyrinomonadaceae bacterium MAG19_C2-C3]|nr:(2Fe-2S)-binding protein [Pyrinomonadaceae bacterium MAG19_C2-C3]
MTDRSTAFVSFLSYQDSAAWQRALDSLAPDIHEVDRTATDIWFHFFPLDLFLALEQSDDADTLARKLLLEGEYRLAAQVDTSPRFLYGHRFWAETKQAVLEYANKFDGNEARELANVTHEIAQTAARIVKVDASLLTGITLVALMTLRQTSLAAFSNATDAKAIRAMHTNKQPAEILRERARDEGQGILGFLRTEDKKWTVRYDESRKDRRFTCINSEEIASGAARDHHEDWHALDPRRSEGPIPVQCRAAACGTCWIGVLGGAEKLSPVSRLEATAIKEFGYINTDEERPTIRLACMAQANGAVSIVIPTWNGFFGKYLQTGSPAQMLSTELPGYDFPVASQTTESQTTDTTNIQTGA